MKVCILSGAPLKASDGVGDFSYALAEELKTKHTVTLLAPNADQINADFQTYRLQGSWGYRGCMETLRLIQRLKPDTILVQFVPQLYGLKGASPFFSLLLNTLKRRGYNVVTVAHELNSPFGRTPKTILLGTAHRLMLRLVVNASSKIIATTPFRLNLLRKRFHKRESSFHCIPVSSTITRFPVDKQKQAALRTELGLTSEHFIVATFGNMAGEAVVFLKTFLTWLANENSLARFLFLGKESKSLKQEFKGDIALHERIFATGQISEEQISQSLSISDLYVVFYPDGASTRRTSLMAGLAHGMATVSNSGILTDADLASSQAVYLIRDFSEKEFTALKESLKDKKWLENMRHQAFQYFEKNLSWPKISADYCHLLKGST